MQKQKTSSKLISKGTAHRLLATENMRVSAKGAEELSQWVSGQLKGLGSASAEILAMIKNKKTVTKELLIHAARKVCICEALVAPQKSKGVPQAAAVRAFRRGLGPDYRMSSEAKECVAGIADALVGDIRQRASNTAAAEKRVTLKVRDVQAAEGKRATVKTRGRGKQEPAGRGVLRR